MMNPVVILKNICCAVFFCLLLVSSLHAQDLQLFRLDVYEKENNERMGFISLSDIYPISNHPDSLPIPDVTGDAGYFKLDSVYRERFLTGTKILETSKLFIYDYSRDILARFTVKDLNVVARLNIYTSPDECPCPAHYYMIGFEINNTLLKDFENEFYHTLIYVGKKNPFVGGGLKPIFWKKIEPGAFQSSIVGVKDTAGLPNPAKGDIYTFETDGLFYFVQDVFLNDMQQERSLAVIKVKTKELVYREVFSEGESASLAPLTMAKIDRFISEQWTGKLFKKKPEVVFGFEYHSFGCPWISLLGQPGTYIGINCDNRH